MVYSMEQSSKSPVTTSRRNVFTRLQGQSRGYSANPRHLLLVEKSAIVGKRKEENPENQEAEQSADQK